jgi:hypothetical protein
MVELLSPCGFTEKSPFHPQAVEKCRHFTFNINAASISVVVFAYFPKFTAIAKRKGLP